MKRTNTMSDQEKKQTSITPRPDAENKKQSGELSDAELNKVTGGAGSDYFLTLSDTKGESQDDPHKGK